VLSLLGSLFTYRYCYLLASKQVAEPVWHIPDGVCTVLNSWWWTERPSETWRVLFQNKKIVDIVHLVGFIIEKREKLRLWQASRHADTHVIGGRASHYKKEDNFIARLLYSRRNPLDRKLFTPKAVPEGTMEKKQTLETYSFNP